MSTPAEDLGPEALIEAIARRERCGHGDDPLAVYWRRRTELLAEALGLPDDWEHAKRTPMMLRSLAVESIRETTFARIVEYGWAPGEEALVEAQRPALEAVAGELRRRYADLALALLLLGWPRIEGRRTTLGALEAAGLPAEPDPIDYF